MKQLVATPGYLPPIAYMSVWMDQPEVVFLNDSFYQKQTYRNRTTIYGANGKLNLTIPIAHTPTVGRRKDLEVKIHNTTPWQHNHWKSFEAAYRSSPFFEFYEDHIRPFYQKDFETLFEFNTQLIQTFFELIDHPKKVVLCAFDQNTQTDFSHFLNAKTSPPPTPVYTQVFENKKGFLSNLSCIDLLFNLGPETATYLKNFSVHQINASKSLH